MKRLPIVILMVVAASFLAFNSMGKSTRSLPPGNYEKIMKLVGVISGTPSKISTWQTKYGIPAANCYNYSDFDNIKNNPDIDAVYIITPNALHKDQAIRVARAGKHVICEKPMALNAKEGEEMIAACQQAGVKLIGKAVLRICTTISAVRFLHKVSTP